MSNEQAGALFFCTVVGFLLLGIAAMSHDVCKPRTCKIYFWLGIFFVIPVLLRMYIIAIAG